MFENMRTKRLCSLVSKEFEIRGYCAWPVKSKNRSLNLGVTLPDDIFDHADELKKFEDAVIEINKKYPKASISYTPPIFSAGGVYASYLEVKCI